jgi:hypothetical protein
VPISTSDDGALVDDPRQLREDLAALDLDDDVHLVLDLLLPGMAMLTTLMAMAE